MQGCKDQNNPVKSQGEKLDLNRSGTRIGVPEGAAAMTVGEQKYPQGKIVYFNSLSEGYLAVQTKKIDAFLFDRNSMEYVARSNPALALLDEKIADKFIVIGFPKKNSALCSEVNAFIKKYRNDGTYDDMFKRWCLTKVLPEVPQQDSKVISEIPYAQHSAFTSSGSRDAGRQAAFLSAKGRTYQG